MGVFLARQSPSIINLTNRTFSVKSEDSASHSFLAWVMDPIRRAAWAGMFLCCAVLLVLLLSRRYDYDVNTGDEQEYNQGERQRGKERNR